MQQLAQLLPGDGDPLRLGLGDRQHRSSHGGAARPGDGRPRPQPRSPAGTAAARRCRPRAGRRAGRWCGARRGRARAWTRASASSSRSPSCASRILRTPLPAGVQVVAAGLDQPVGAQHQRLAGLQDEPGGRVVGVRVDAQRQPAGGRPLTSTVPSAMRIAGSGWPARAISRMPVDRVDLHVEAGRERAGRRRPSAVGDAVQEAGGAGEHGVGAVPLGGVRPQRDAQLAHEARRAHVVTLDVPDDQGEPASSLAREAPAGSGIMSYQSPPTWRPPPVGM